MKSFLLSLGLIAAVGGCSLINSFDDVDPGDGSGASGAASSGGTGGTSGSGGASGGMGGSAGNGGLGGGGMGGLPNVEINCAFEEPTSSVIDTTPDGTRYGRNLIAVDEGVHIRAFLDDEDSQGLRVFAINDDGTSPAQGFVPGTIKIFQAERLDITRIGVLALEQIGASPAIMLYVFQDSDFSFTPNKFQITALGELDDSPQAAWEDIDARFVKVGGVPEDLAIVVQYNTDSVAKLKFARHPPGPPVALKQILPDAPAPEDVEIRAFGRATNVNIVYAGQPFSPSQVSTQRFAFGDNHTGFVTGQMLGPGQVFLLGAETKGDGTINVAGADLAALALLAGNISVDQVDTFTTADLNMGLPIDGEALPDGSPGQLGFLGDLFPFIGELPNGDLGLVAYGMDATEVINDVLTSPQAGAEIASSAFQERDGGAQFGAFGGRVHTVWVEDVDKGQPTEHSTLNYNMMDCNLVMQ